MHLWNLLELCSCLRLSSNLKNSKVLVGILQSLVFTPMLISDNNFNILKYLPGCLQFLYYFIRKFNVNFRQATFCIVISINFMVKIYYLSFHLSVMELLLEDYSTLLEYFHLIFLILPYHLNY